MSFLDPVNAQLSPFSSQVVASSASSDWPQQAERVTIAARSPLKRSLGEEGTVPAGSRPCLGDLQNRKVELHATLNILEKQLCYQRAHNLMRLLERLSKAYNALLYMSYLYAEEGPTNYVKEIKRLQEQIKELEELIAADRERVVSSFQEQNEANLQDEIGELEAKIARVVAYWKKENPKKLIIITPDMSNYASVLADIELAKKKIQAEEKTIDWPLLNYQILRWLGKKTGLVETKKMRLERTQFQQFHEAVVQLTEGWFSYKICEDSETPPDVEKLTARDASLVYYEKARAQLAQEIVAFQGYNGLLELLSKMEGELKQARLEIAQQLAALQELAKQPVASLDRP